MMWGVGTMVLMWRSEKSFMELVLSLPFVGSVGRIKVIEPVVTTPPQFLFFICRMGGCARTGQNLKDMRCLPSLS